MASTRRVYAATVTSITSWPRRDSSALSLTRSKARLVQGRGNTTILAASALKLTQASKTSALAHDWRYDAMGPA